jgi:hypothetical protein
MNLFIKILGGCIIASSFFSCSNQEKQNTKATSFPNKDSVLAILMRDVVENTVKLKNQIVNGEKIDFFMEFEKLHTAIPTDSDVRDDGRFTSFADSYISTIKELINSEEDKTSLYNNMIQACVRCHEQICPGPVKRIKKLRIK